MITIKSSLSKWINRELWKWLRAHVALEDRVTGEVINELIDRYKSDTTGWLGGKLDMTSCYEPDIKSQLSIRGSRQRTVAMVKSTQHYGRAERGRNS